MPMETTGWCLLALELFVWTEMRVTYQHYLPWKGFCLESGIAHCRAGKGLKVLLFGPFLPTRATLASKYLPNPLTKLFRLGPVLS